MTIRHVSVFFILILYLAGCSWIKTPSWVPFTHKKNQEILQAPDTTVAVKAIPVDEGQMLAPEKLQKGGKILLVPFQAGGNVAATDELDKISFRVMQGISRSFEYSSKPNFKILINLEQSEPDFIIDGYFTVKKESSDFLSKWFFKKKKYVIGVEGKLMDANSKEVLAVFSDTVVSSSPQEDFINLGFKVGQNIGDFIRVSLTQ
ncbi:MAG: hypothetical protein KBD53_02210 [Candidatus Omnitrophica bacterium]|nr:hypothetical protein [Candidatus Omnitrophota bacterium]